MECSCCGNNDTMVKSVDKTLVDPILEKYAGSSGNLIAILQKAQDIYGYLPNDLLLYIAKKTGIKPAKIYGVVTFYAQFRTAPAGKNHILLCQGTACHVNGSADIEAAVKEFLKTEEGRITENGLFSYDNVACLGCCSLSPVMMINGRTFGELTREKVKKILTEIEAEG